MNLIQPLAYTTLWCSGRVYYNVVYISNQDETQMQEIKSKILQKSDKALIN